MGNKSTFESIREELKILTDDEFCSSCVSQGEAD